MEDEIVESLYKRVKNSNNIKEAIKILFENNLITLPRKERNKSIQRDFVILYRNNAIKVKDIYTTLSVKYDLSQEAIKKIVSKRK